nr:uncharacterized protein LOC124808609 [Hydra vulgaris]
MIDSPDIILISETWFKNDLIINIRNYNCFYNNRTNKQGGGVAIFTKYDIIAYEVSVSPLYKEVEQIWCSIVLHKTKILVACIYRPPNSTDLINNAINELIKTAKKEVMNGKYSNVIIVGDFNYPNIIWNEDGTIELKQNCQTSRAFINNLQNNYLHQVVNKPTFQMAVDKPANILDLIICDDLDLIINIEYDAPLGQITKSHYILKWEINILNSYEKKFNNKRFNFRNGKYKEMNLMFYKNLVRKKRSLWCRVRATNFKNTNLNNEYKLINKTIKKQIKKSTFDYEINLAKDVKHNPKRFYAYAQRKNQTHTKLLALKTSDNKIITDKKVVANLLNCSFQSVFVKENQDLPYFSNKTSHLFECDWDQELKEDIIFNYLLELNENKSLGCDNISPYVLKHCAEGLSKPLSLIFKKSIHSGKLPELWKSANITPLFKKGDKKDPLNYRPISLTSIPSKIIEKIIRKKLIIYITENNLLTSQQHGFIQNKGCLTNLLETFDIITTEIENGYPVDILKQRVVMGEVVSDWCEVYSGVPQGSVLGPLLFLLYINDLPQCISSIAKLYADDTKIISVIKEHNDLANMQNDIDLLTEWSNVWLMDFNINKCSVMHIGRKNINYNYTIKHDNQSFLLKTTTKELDLGVIVSSNMKLNHQVQVATSKAQRILCLIRKSFTYLNTEMVRQLYTSLVRPHLEFAAPVWSPSNKNNINDLEKIQRRATKLAPELKHLSYTERLTKLGLTTLETRRIRGDLIAFFKLTTGIDKILWYKEPNKASSQRLRGHPMKFEREFAKTTPRHNFFTNRVIPHWNALPEKVVSAMTLYEALTD